MEATDSIQHMARRHILVPVVKKNYRTWSWCGSNSWKITFMKEFVRDIYPDVQREMFFVPRLGWFWGGYFVMFNLRSMVTSHHYPYTIIYRPCRLVSNAKNQHTHYGNSLLTINERQNEKLVENELRWNFSIIFFHKFTISHSSSLSNEERQTHTKHL